MALHVVEVGANLYFGPTVFVIKVVARTVRGTVLGLWNLLVCWTLTLVPPAMLFLRFALQKRPFNFWDGALQELWERYWDEFFMQEQVDALVPGWTYFFYTVLFYTCVLSMMIVSTRLILGRWQVLIALGVAISWLIMYAFDPLAWQEGPCRRGSKIPWNLVYMRPLDESPRNSGQAGYFCSSTLSTDQYGRSYPLPYIVEMIGPLLLTTFIICGRMLSCVSTKVVALWAGFALWCYPRELLSPHFRPSDLDTTRWVWDNKVPEQDEWEIPPYPYIMASCAAFIVVLEKLSGLTLVPTRAHFGKLVVLYWIYDFLVWLFIYTQFVW